MTTWSEYWERRLPKTLRVLGVEKELEGIKTFQIGFEPVWPLEVNQIIELLRESESGSMGPRSFQAKVALLEMLLDMAQKDVSEAYALQNATDAVILRSLGL